MAQTADHFALHRDHQEIGRLALCSDSKEVLHAGQ